MEKIDVYVDKLKENKYIEDKNSHDLAMIRLMYKKIKIKYNLTRLADVAKLLGYNDSYLSKIFNGHYPISKNLIRAFCHVGGVTMDELQGEYTKRNLDEYINGKGHLIIDGDNYGKIIK